MCSPNIKKHFNGIQNKQGVSKVAPAKKTYLTFNLTRTQFKRKLVFTVKLCPQTHHNHFSEQNKVARVRTAYLLRTESGLARRQAKGRRNSRSILPKTVPSRLCCFASPAGLGKAAAAVDHRPTWRRLRNAFPPGRCGG